MTSTATDVRIDVVFLSPHLAVLFTAHLFTVFVQRNKGEVGHQFWVAKMLFWIAMAIETPLHRKRLDLSYDFHLVDSSVTGNATDTRSDVGRVVKVNKVGQVGDSFPADRVTVRLSELSRFKAVANRL